MAELPEQTLSLVGNVQIYMARERTTPVILDGLLRSFLRISGSEKLEFLPSEQPEQLVEILSNEEPAPIPPLPGPNYPS